VRLSAPAIALHRWLRLDVRSFETGGGQNMGNLIGFVLGLSAFAGWCQHLYTCFNEKLWDF
jgi:hypothetical protein